MKESKMRKLDKLTRGGNGAHWEGCENTHWDCRIAYLEEKCTAMQEELEYLRNRHKARS